VDDAAQASLVLDDAVWHLHLPAQSGQEQNDLDGVDVTGNDDQLRFLLLNEGGDGVDAVADNWGPLGSLGLLILTVLCLLLSALAKAASLLLLGLWAVLVQKFEQLGSLIASAACESDAKQSKVEPNIAPRGGFWVLQRTLSDPFSRDSTCLRGL